ncbi:MAG: choice-of-anchor L domain-containing protein [Flavobacteriales bacterium]|nr:choice-of-anchor L domain-containing protein [Flavobacteriales bacterium]MCB9167357.1 choice-of-anchor L domain-containing protein [Flavobacteriales bacterium]
MRTRIGAVGMVVGCMWALPRMCEAQLVVDNTITVADLVENVLLGGGVTVSNITFNGQPANQANIQIGSFDGTNCNVGMNNGIMLSSGDIHVALGPNNDGGDTEPAGGIGGPGDPDLDQASNSNTHDAAVLEFDFIPSGDSLSFNYVFASEEYLEFVGLGFNDVFGFFLSGPGISGPYSNNAANIALIPNTTTPVSIDNVNDLSNPSYYVDNGDGITPPYNTDPSYIQFDGLTTVLTAFSLVQCGQPYHIKIAIADAGDAILDSGVFIEGGSFTSPNAIQLQIVTASADGTLTEGCSDATFIISRPGDQDSLEVSVTVSGSATNGTDYTSIPSVITIPEGQDSVSFPVQAFDDGIAEGQEEIVLTATFVNTCGDTSISMATVPIVDYVPIDLTSENLSLQCDQDSVPISVQATGGYGALSYQWSNGSSTNMIYVPGMADGSYVVHVSDDCAHDVARTVIVDSNCEVVVPNVFSPNNDGSNDVFEIAGIEGTSNRVRIYNRWGQVIYEQQNYKNNWDARDVNDGTYYYEVLVDGKDPLIGALTIVGHRH